MEITIDDFYKVLRFHDSEIRKHFNDDSYSDSDYFFCAINEDIIQNTINIINCLKANYPLSPSVDNSCRTIIESFCVLKMRATGAICDEQLKLFRNQYVLVDYLNIKRYVKQYDSKYKEQIINDYEKTITLFCKFYNCTKRQLLLESVDDPNFYLKKSLKDTIRFKSLLKKYPVFDEEKYKLYDFFSILSHPYFTFDNELYKNLINVRDNMIDIVLNYVFEYFKNSKLWVNDCKEASFDEIFTNNDILVNNRVNLSSLKVLFENVIGQSCFFEDGYDLFEIIYLTSINELIGGMLVNFSLGYREQVIVDFKNFIEISAVHSYINHAETQEEYKILKKAFDVTTLLQLCDFFKETTEKECYFEKEMKELFEQYYKDKYNLTNFEIFYNNVMSNSLYFIFNDKKSYKSVVRQMLDDIYQSGSETSSSIYTTFQIANDFAHGGGYSFNASPGMVDDISTKVLWFVFLHLKILLINIIETGKEHNKNINFNKEIEFIDTMLSFYADVNENIVKEYLANLT